MRVYTDFWLNAYVTSKSWLKRGKENLKQWLQELGILRGLQKRKIGLTSNHTVCTTNIQLMRMIQLKSKFLPCAVIQSCSSFTRCPVIYLLLIFTLLFFFNWLFCKFKTCQERESDTLKFQIRKGHIPRLWKILFPFLSKRIWLHIIQIHQKEPKVLWAAS